MIDTGKRIYKSYAIYDSIKDIFRIKGEKLERQIRVGHGKILNGKRPKCGVDLSFKAKTNKFFKKQVHKKERNLNKIFMDINNV